MQKHKEKKLGFFNSLYCIGFIIYLFCLSFSEYRKEEEKSFTGIGFFFSWFSRKASVYILVDF